jgi:hypothetical protein
MAKQVGAFILTAALIIVAGPTGFAVLTAAQVTMAIVAAAISTVVGYVFRPKLGNFGLFDRSRMVRQAITSRRIIYGYQKVSGPIVFITSTNNDKYLHMVIALADHEIHEIESFYLNDLRVFTDANGFVTASEYNRGNSLVRIKAKLGADNQTAESTLVSEVSEWTNDHRLQGIAYLYVRLEFNDKVFQQGIPNISAVVRGKKVYDYRTSTTAYSYNPALCLADYLTSTRHGLGCDVSELDTASIIAAANVCDENVLLDAAPSAISQGTYEISGSWYEDRYQCHGVIDTEKNPGENIEQLLTSMGGTLAYVGGKWTMKAAAYSSPAMTLTIDDLRGPIGMQTKVPRNEVFNAVKGMFINPDASWQATDYAAVTSATFEAEDGNRQIFVDLNLPFTISHSMAQRLAKIGLYRSRQEITLTLACKLKAFDLKPGDTVNVTIDRYGFSSKVFEVVDWQLGVSNEEMGVDLQLRELNAAVFDWNADEQAFNEDNTTLPNSYDEPDALTNVTFSAVARINADGTTVPLTTISWTQSSNIFVQSGGRIEVEYKKNSDTNWIAMNSVSGDAVEIVIEGLEPEEYYDFRVRAVNVNGVTSEWVSLLNRQIAIDTTAPGVATSLAATGAYKTIQLTWTNPTDADWFQTEIWRSTTNNSATATRIGSVSASTYADSGLASATTYYYWLKTKDYTGNTSAFSTGANATTNAEAIDGTNGLNGLTFINAYKIQDQSTAAPSFTTPTSGSALPSGWSPTVGSPTVGQVVWYLQGRYNSSGSTIDGVAANTTAWTGPVAASVFQDIRSDNWDGSSPPSAGTVGTWGSEGYYISRTSGNIFANGFYARGKAQVEGNNDDLLGTAFKVNVNAATVFGILGYGDQTGGRGVAGLSGGSSGVGVTGSATASGARAGVLAIRTAGTGAALEVSGGTIVTDNSTVVTNLNADKVDGYNGTDFVRIASGTTNDKYFYYLNNTETPSDPNNRAAWIKVSTNDGGVVFFPGYI